MTRGLKVTRGPKSGTPVRRRRGGSADPRHPVGWGYDHELRGFRPPCDLSGPRQLPERVDEFLVRWAELRLRNQLTALVEDAGHDALSVHIEPDVAPSNRQLHR
jgi:hypothetical protein